MGRLSRCAIRCALLVGAFVAPLAAVKAQAIDASAIGTASGPEGLVHAGVVGQARRAHDHQVNCRRLGEPKGCDVILSDAPRP